MKKTNLLLAAAFSMALGSIAMNASACSTVVVGKDVSATGQIMIGHNEDNDLRIVTSQYWVPAADHKAGELITYEPTTAKIPQVAHTYGFYWTQTLHPDGYSFSDGFVNENGVAIVTNNCNNTLEEKNPVVDGGVGYGIRRLMPSAPRAPVTPSTSPSSFSASTATSRKAALIRSLTRTKPGSWPFIRAIRGSQGACRTMKLSTFRTTS